MQSICKLDPDRQTLKKKGYPTSGDPDECHPTTQFTSRPMGREGPKPLWPPAEAGEMQEALGTSEF